MTTYLIENIGQNDIRLNLDTAITIDSVGDYFEFKGYALAGNPSNNYRLAGIKASNSYVVELQNGGAKIGFSSNYKTFNTGWSKPTLGQVFTLRVERVAASTWEVFLNGVSLGTQSTSNNLVIDTLMNFSTSNPEGFRGGMYYAEACTDGTGVPTNRWTNETGSGEVVDVIGSNDTTKSGTWPIDGSDFTPYADYTNNSHLLFNGAGSAWVDHRFDIVGADSFSVKSKNVKWVTDVGYLWGQASDSIGTREFCLFRYNDYISIAYGGNDSQLISAGDMATMFPDDIIEGDIELTYVKSTGAATLFLDGVEIGSTTISGTQFNSNTKWRMGARSNTNGVETGTTSERWIVSDGRIGDTQLVINNELVADWVMPVSGDTIIENVQRRDATIFGFPADDSMWYTHIKKNYVLEFDGSLVAMTDNHFPIVEAVSNVRVVSKNVYWVNTTGYLWSQANSGSREFGLYRNVTQLGLWIGGVYESFMSEAEELALWPDGIIKGELDVRVDRVAGTTDLYVDKVYRGTANIGSGNTNDPLTTWRFGARSSQNGIGSTIGENSSFKMQAGEQCGDTQLFIDDELVADWIMPKYGTTIKDSVAGNDANLYSFTDDNSMWVPISVGPHKDFGLSADASPWIEEYFRIDSGAPVNIIDGEVRPTTRNPTWVMYDANDYRIDESAGFIEATIKVSANRVATTGFVFAAIANSNGRGYLLAITDGSAFIQKFSSRFSFTDISTSVAVTVSSSDEFTIRWNQENGEIAWYQNDILRDTVIDTDYGYVDNLSIGFAMYDDLADQRGISEIKGLGFEYIGQEVETSMIESTNTYFNPTISTDATSIGPALIDSTEAVLNPDVSMSNLPVVIVAPSIPDPIYAIGSDGKCSVNFSGTYSGGEPSAIEYRVMSGATEIDTWKDVDSFSGGTYNFVPDTGFGEGLNFEVRATSGANVNTNSTAVFDIGIVIALLGSSSASRLFDLSSDTTDGRVHTKKSGTWVTTDNASMSGAGAVNIANFLYQKIGCPVGFYDNGTGGSTLLGDWNTETGSDYSDLVSAITNGNVSVFFNQCGYNDAASSVTITESNVINLIDSLREDVGYAVFLEGASQRKITGSYNATFNALWKAEEGAVSSSADSYIVWRHDLEIGGDNIHLTTAADVVYEQRFAAIIDAVFSDGTYINGPKISQVSYNGSSLTVTLDRSGSDYTVISPSSGIEGFSVIDGNGAVTLTSVVATDADTIVITADSELESPIEVSFAGYNQNVSEASEFSGYPTVNSEVSMPLAPLTSPVLSGVVLSERYSLVMNGSGTAWVDRRYPIIQADKVVVTTEDVYWSSGDGYLWSQASAKFSGSREFGLFRYLGALQFAWGGADGQLLTSAEMTSNFPSGIIEGKVTVEVDNIANTAELFIDDVKVGDTLTISSGTSFRPDVKWRFGSRSSVNSGDTGPSSAFRMSSGNRIGNTKLWIDDVLTADWVMPATGYTIEDLVSGDDAVLYGFPANDTMWYLSSAPYTEIIVPDLVSTTSVFSPTVGTEVYGLVPSLAVSTSSVFSPVVAGDNPGIVVSLIQSTDSYFGPSISAGSVETTPALIESTESLPNPSIGVGTAEVTPGVTVSDSEVFSPVITSSVNVAADTISESTQVMSPSLSTGPVGVSTSLVLGTSYVPNPVILTDDAGLIVGTILSTVVFPEPEVSVSSVAIGPSIILSTTFVPTPSAISGNGIATDSIASGATVYQPSVGTIVVPSTNIGPSIITGGGTGVVGLTAEEIADAVWQATTRSLTTAPSGGLDESELHDALDNYTNKDLYKADLSDTTWGLAQVVSSINGLNDFDPSVDTVFARNMRGTDGVSTVVHDDSVILAAISALHNFDPQNQGVIATNMRGTDGAITSHTDLSSVIAAIGALNNFNPATDTVEARNMRGTDNAATDLTGVSSKVDLLLEDTNNLRANQGDWVTADLSGIISVINALNDFDPTTQQVVASNMRGTDGANTDTPPTVQAVANAVKLILAGDFDSLDMTQEVIDLVTAIKAKTDNMVFTKENELDVNQKSINSSEVYGNGTDTNKWRGTP